VGGVVDFRFDSENSVTRNVSSNEPSPRDRFDAGVRRRYLAPRLIKGPMLAAVTAGDTVMSGVFR
jgi:hypothetical protein